METFSYIAKDRKSETKRGLINAASRDEAVKLIQSRGLCIIAINVGPKEQETSKGQVQKKFPHSGIKLQDLSLLARQLATLLSSGVTLLRSLEIVSMKCESRKLSNVLQDITNDIKSGLSLTESIGRYPKVFSSLWRGLIDTGEASGNLSAVLNRLAEYLELRQEFLRKLVSALTYPIVLFVAAIGALLFFTLFIIPKFQEIFLAFDTELPILTRLIFDTTTFVREKFAVILVLAAGLFFGLRFFIRTKGGHHLLDHLQLKTFFFKDFFYTFYLERFSSVTAILFESGVPIGYALDGVQRSIGHQMFEEILATVRDQVKAGKSLSSELARTNFFSPMLVEMVTIGEEVGNFPEMLSKVAEHYKVALQTKVERFTSLFEPLMIIFMGAVVGLIVISLFLPLFELASVVS